MQSSNFDFRNHEIDIANIMNAQEKDSKNNLLKKYYQVCHTSHKEVMFRDEEDYGMYLNFMALSAFASDTEIIVDAEMSTHTHQGIYSRNPQYYVSYLCQRHTKYMNRKYGRTGSFRDSEPFISEICGYRHAIAFTTYVLRNGLHHGVSSTPFSYNYSTANHLFLKDLGKTPEPAVITRRSEIASFLPRKSNFPDEYIMNSSGIFVRRSFMQLEKCESYYKTPRSFIFQMNMITDDKWLKEQEKDLTDEKAITLDVVEQGFSKESINEMLRNENGFKYDPDRLTDLEICRIIDREMIGRFKAGSIYSLCPRQKESLYRELIYDLKVHPASARRCLAL